MNILIKLTVNSFCFDADRKVRPNYNIMVNSNTLYQNIRLMQWFSHLLKTCVYKIVFGMDKY